MYWLIFRHLRPSPSHQTYRPLTTTMHWMSSATNTSMKEVQARSVLLHTIPSKPLEGTHEDWFLLTPSKYATYSILQPLTHTYSSFFQHLLPRKMKMEELDLDELPLDLCERWWILLGESRTSKSEPQVRSLRYAGFFYISFLLFWGWR